MEATGDEATSHSMRIATHGKISLLVTFALKFLKENPTRPLVLHTLPHKPKTREDNDMDVSTTEPAAKKQKITSATNDIPRLISVVEIIKREFKDAPLHQYNELGCLDAPEVGAGAKCIPTEPGGERQAALQDVLKGKNHLPIQRTPYMKITLSRVVLSESAAKGTTYQPPVVKKPSKAAKARSRRNKQQKDLDSGRVEEARVDDTMEVIPI